MRPRLRATSRPALVRWTISHPRELGDGAQHLQGEHSLRCGVNRIAQAAEIRSLHPQLFDHREQMADRASKPV
jgi:hypothetical protein